MGLTTKDNPAEMDMIDKLHRASCMVGLVSRVALDANDPLTGETLKAAEDLILSAMEDIDRASLAPRG